MDAFLTGVLAGYGIAIPVGAIAILIVEVGIRRGFWPAFLAGFGAASADFLYSGLAVIGGAALAGAIGTVSAPLRVISGLTLIVIAVIGLRRVRRSSTAPGISEGSRTDLVRTYARFLGLTIINPATIVYFAAVIVGLGVAEDLSPGQGISFAIGAFLASLSWQTLLAAVGTLARHRLSPRARAIAIVLGNVVILALAVVILTR